MSINFHDANNKYTYANRNAHISWQETINNIVDVQNKQVIDIGCGGGIYTKELALMGAKNVVGLDFSKEILQAAKENCNAFPNISFIHGDAHNIPYPNESFDLVISRAVIHHLQDVPTFIREASRILKKTVYLFYKTELLKIVQFQEVLNTFVDTFSLYFQNSLK